MGKPVNLSFRRPRREDRSMSGPVHAEARADDARSAIEPAKWPSSPGGVDYVLALQRSVGNQGVAGLLGAADTPTATMRQHTKSTVVQRDDGPSTRSETYGAAQPGDRPGTGGGPGFGTGMDAT